MEKYKPEYILPINQLTKGESLDIQVDDGRPNLNTEYLEEYDDLIKAFL